MKIPALRLPPQIAPWVDRLNELTMRERVLISGTVLALVTVIWHLFVLEPLTQDAANSRQRLAELQERLLTANDSLEEQVWRLTGDGAEQRRQIDSLTRQLQQTEVALGDYNRELIEPGEMAKILEGMLEKQSSLALIHLRNLPPESLQVTDEEGAPVFYRHGLEIEVEGRYADCLDYLMAVESLPWRLYWQAVDIEVLDYPRNRIRIEVSTLSLNEEWIGA